MNNKQFLENEDQFIVSYELLYILQWIMTYQKQAFTDLVHQAFIQGSQTQIIDDRYDQMEEAEYLQNSVIDFFSFLEQEVAHVAHDQSMQHVMQQNLVTTLDHMDPKLFDPAIIQASMMMTAEKMHARQDLHAKEVFLKQLLKKWQPKKDKNKKHSLH